MPRWPSPPIPWTATRSLGCAPLWRSALKVVIPAQSSGAASAGSSDSGIRATASTGAIMYSRISAVVTESGDLHVGTVHEVATPAREAGPVLTAVPAHADSLTVRPLRHARAHVVDHPRDFVPRHARIHEARPAAFLGEDVAVTDAARLDANPDVPRPRRWESPAQQSQSPRRPSGPAPLSSSPSPLSSDHGSRFSSALQAPAAGTFSGRLYVLIAGLVAAEATALACFPCRRHRQSAMHRLPLLPHPSIGASDERHEPLMNIGSNRILGAYRLALR